MVYNLPEAARSLRRSVLVSQTSTLPKLRSLSFFSWVHNDGDWQKKNKKIRKQLLQDALIKKKNTADDKRGTNRERVSKRPAAKEISCGISAAAAAARMKSSCCMAATSTFVRFTAKLSISTVPEG